jgi:hypothetical protein
MPELFFCPKRSLERPMVTENFRPPIELLGYGPAIGELSQDILDPFVRHVGSLLKSGE